MKLGPFAIVGTVMLAVACSGCGSGGGGGTSSTATRALPSGTPATLRGAHGGMLVAGELSGFVPHGTPALATSAQSWFKELPPGQGAAEAARFAALGFVAGLGEKLAPSHGGEAEAISSVEQFRSSQDARAVLTSELQRARSRGESIFAAARIPGSRGFGSREGLNIAFTVGPYYYIVGAGIPSTGTPGLPTHAQLVAAAETLYRRVRG